MRPRSPCGYQSVQLAGEAVLNRRIHKSLHLPLTTAVALAAFGIGNFAAPAHTYAAVSDRDSDRESDRDSQHPDEHDDRDEHRRHAHEREKQALEEVIVTAEKREENLQKTPLTVTAVTGDELQRAGVTDAQRLTDIVPGLEVGNLGSTTTFTIRGVTSNTDPNLGDSPTAFHIDGIYQGRPAAASGLFYDVNRIEVLRGPQGTLYGKDSTAGTINLITNKPDFHGTDGAVQMEFASYDLYRAFGVVNVPVNNDFAFRIALQTERHKGYLATGYDDADDIAGRVHLLWRPSQTFSALFTQDYFHQGGVGAGQVPIAELGPSQDPGVPWGGDYWHKDPWSLVLPLSQQGLNEYGFTPKSNNVSNQTSLQLDWDLGGAQLTSITAYHHLHLDATAYLNGTPSLQQETDSEVSQELRLASPNSSLIKWVVGAYYHRERQTNDLFFYDQAGPGTDSVQIFPKIDTPSYALFGQVTYPIQPNWRVTAGLRGNIDKKNIDGSINQINYLVVNPQDLIVPFKVPLVVDRTTLVDVGCPPPNPAICLQAAPNGSLSASRVTWRVGMDYDLTRDSLLFFNISTGYKQGGLDASRPPDNVYSPETNTAYEIGSKNRFLDDRLQANIYAFLYDYKNYQVDQLEFFPGISAPVFGDFISNAARARHEGVELETEARLTEHDLLSINIAYLYAVFKEYLYPLPPDPANPSLDITYEDLSGYSEFNAPRWSGTLSYQHSWALPHDAQLAFNVLSHVESYSWLSPNHVPDSRQPGYSRSQIGLQYSSANDKYEVQAYVHNLENRVVNNNYTFQGQPTPAVAGPLGFGPGAGSLATRNFVTVDPPRTYGLSFQVKF
jgi:iron complex outermembrane receptor protein